MSNELKMTELKHPTVKTYVIGFILSILLTLASYIVTLIHVNSYHETIPHEVLIPTILVFAITQLIVQLVYFLHLWQEAKPRWNLLFFISTIGVILLVVVGSIWIMQHLNHNMTPMQMEQYVKNSDDF